MIFLNTLKILVDLSLYCSFASIITFWFGGGNLFYAMIIPALCFGLSCRFEENKRARILSMVPCLICFLIPGLHLADRIGALPAVFYGVYLAVNGDYTLSCYRQRDIFPLFIKLYIPFGIIVTLVGFRSALGICSLPAAITTLSCCVYLMRVLRHDREVYLQKKYLAVSAIPLVIVAIAAWVLTIPVVLEAIKSALSGLYLNVIAPVLFGMTYVFGKFCDKVLLPFMNWIKALPKRKHSSSMDFSGMVMDDPFEGEVVEPTVTSQTVMLTIVIVVLTAFFLLILFLLFKKLTQKWGDGGALSNSKSDTDVELQAAAKRPSILSRDPVDLVRRYYLAYLKMSISKGYQREVSHTSGDVSRFTEQFYSDDAGVNELREIYIKARYRGSATQEDAKRAKELLKRLRGSAV